MTPLFSTAYLPPVRYVAALLRHPDALIEAKETFPKQTYRNRALILTAGGVRALSVPVLRDNHSRTEQVAVDYSDRWPVVHMRTLEAAYAASPFFFYYKDGLFERLAERHDSLLSLNLSLLRWVLGLLKVDLPLGLTADWLPPSGHPLDFRNAFSPKRPRSGEGLNSYYQVFADRLPFEPDLSVLDLLFCLGPEAKAYLEAVA